MRGNQVAFCPSFDAICDFRPCQTIDFLFVHGELGAHGHTAIQYRIRTAQAVCHNPLDWRHGIEIHKHRYKYGPARISEGPALVEYSDMRLLAPFRAIVLVQLLFPLTLASAIPGRTSIDPHGTVTPFNETLPVATSLSERAWPDHRRTFYTVTTAVGLTFLVRFRVLELVSPADALAGVAANDLVFFYKAAFAVARVLWAQDEPRKVRRARINGILLMFWSETPIRWDFLQGFFEHIVGRLLHFLL